MKRPYDLVAFLQQERRVEQLEELKEVLADTSSLDKVADKHEPDLESRFYDKVRKCENGAKIQITREYSFSWIGFGLSKSRPAFD